MEWYMGQLGTSLMEKNVELEVEWWNAVLGIKIENIED
jgi:hypothetical protein